MSWVVFRSSLGRFSHGKPSRTNLVVYRTTDGGATWRPQVVGLAGR